MSVHTRWVGVGVSALALTLTVGLAPAAHADVDVRTPYEAQVSCDPRPKPGVTRFAAWMRARFKTGYIGTYRPCAGDTSEHYDSRAMDWMLNVKNPAQNAIAYQVTRWMSANGGVNARRFGISYMIYNHRTWKVYRPERGWTAYTGAVPHTDHVHFSFSWDGAMARTSGWTGRVNKVIDLGPCRVYAGQFAPLRTGIRTAPCPSRLASAPVSSYRVAVYGQRSAQIQVAQRLLRVTADGAFGPATFSKVIAWQRGRVPVTGALDKATWRRLTGK
jgi:Putative peptidoglycan binding domain